MTDDTLDDHLPPDLPDDPMPLAKAWLDHATAKQVTRNPNAMMLGTVNEQGKPSARIVLCKEWQTVPGYLVFYTNYRSQKASEIEGNARVSLVFHWDNLGLQIRIEGRCLRSPAAESDAYFASRDRGSQLGAWGSDQSQPVASRDALLHQLRERTERLENEHDVVPRPPHWGGIRVWADAVELWVDGANRVHDRARWTRDLAADENGGFTTSSWSVTRLQP